MSLTEPIASATTPEGGELALYERRGEYVIRVDGWELMRSRVHGSEQKVAELACEGLRGAEAPRVMIGGLGMGYTLETALQVLPQDAHVAVVELLEAVVEWNRGPLGPLSGHAVDDPRVEVRVEDIRTTLAESRGSWDAIILDVDNGPGALSQEANGSLYGEEGIAQIIQALKPGGMVTVWSADPAPEFAARLEQAGLRVESHEVGPRTGESGPIHTLIVGSLGPAC
jgi:spermidine synthase